MPERASQKAEGALQKKSSTDWNYRADDGQWRTIQIRVTEGAGTIERGFDQRPGSGLHDTLPIAGLPAREVQDQAQYLGLQQEGGVVCKWLAEDALAAPLPAGWAEHLHPESGLVYFLHEASSEAVWNHPFEAHFLEMAPWVAMVTRRLERLLAVPVAKWTDAHTLAIERTETLQRLATSHHRDVVDQLLREETEAQRERRGLRFTKLPSWHVWPPPAPGLPEAAARSLAGDWLAGQMRDAVKSAHTVLERTEQCEQTREAADGAWISLRVLASRKSHVDVGQQQAEGEVRRLAPTGDMAKLRTQCAVMTAFEIEQPFIASAVSVAEVAAVRAREAAAAAESTLVSTVARAAGRRHGTAAARAFGNLLGSRPPVAVAAAAATAAGFPEAVHGLPAPPAFTPASFRVHYPYRATAPLPGAAVWAVPAWTQPAIEESMRPPDGYSRSEPQLVVPSMMRPTGRHDGPAFLPSGSVLVPGGLVGTVAIKELGSRPTRGSLIATLLESTLRARLNDSVDGTAGVAPLGHRWQRMRLRHLQLRRRLMIECDLGPAQVRILSPQASMIAVPRTQCPWLCRDGSLAVAAGKPAACRLAAGRSVHPGVWPPAAGVRSAAGEFDALAPPNMSTRREEKCACCELCSGGTGFATRGSGSRADADLQVCRPCNRATGAGCRLPPTTVLHCC